MKKMVILIIAFVMLSVGVTAESDYDTNIILRDNTEDITHYIDVYEPGKHYAHEKVYNVSKPNLDITEISLFNDWETLNTTLSLKVAGIIEDNELIEYEIVFSWWGSNDRRHFYFFYSNGTGTSQYGARRQLLHSSPVVYGIPIKTAPNILSYAFPMCCKPNINTIRIKASASQWFPEPHPVTNITCYEWIDKFYPLNLDDYKDTGEENNEGNNNNSTEIDYDNSSNGNGDSNDDAGIVNNYDYFGDKSSKDTPGFEIILVIGAIIIVLLCEIYWRKKDE